MQRDRDRLHAPLFTELADLRQRDQFLHVVLDRREADQLVQFLHAGLLRFLRFFGFGRRLRGRFFVRVAFGSRAFTRRAGLRVRRLGILLELSHLIRFFHIQADALAPLKSLHFRSVGAHQFHQRIFDDVLHDRVVFGIFAVKIAVQIFEAVHYVFHI